MSDHYLEVVAPRTTGGAGTRMSAEQRRAVVLAAAVEEFALGGLTGTSTEAIASRAGISQPYLFRLFPTKKELFLAAVRATFTLTRERFETAAGDLVGADALTAIGSAYDELLTDRTYLLMQMQSYASCGDPDIQEVTRQGFRDLWQTVERVSGCDDEELRTFFGHGMLLNVVAAMNLQEIGDRWAREICS
ncbi:TetR/AcrR family transcriptional regulator [Parafrankia sp. BMG5.11]|nr:TetR/AcrR family transcriptional regulator [Parafrankia sp. BMG5.11]